MVLENVVCMTPVPKSKQTLVRPKLIPSGSFDTKKSIPKIEKEEETEETGEESNEYGAKVIIDKPKAGKIDDVDASSEDTELEEDVKEDENSDKEEQPVSESIQSPISIP